MTRMLRRRRPPGLPALLLLLAALALSCSSSKIDPDQPQDESIRQFRETHLECPPHYYRVPCQIGPDGRLYHINPGERDRTKTWK